MNFGYWYVFSLLWLLCCALVNHHPGTWAYAPLVYGLIAHRLVGMVRQLRALPVTMIFGCWYALSLFWLLNHPSATTANLLLGGVVAHYLVTVVRRRASVHLHPRFRLCIDLRAPKSLSVQG